MNALNIKSSYGSDEVSFSLGTNRADLYCEIKVSGFSGRVIADIYGDTTDDLSDFFEDLAAHWQGWKGTKVWSSLGEEIQLLASSDALGHVTLFINLRTNQTTLQTTITMDAGELEGIAKDATDWLCLVRLGHSS